MAGPSFFSRFGSFLKSAYQKISNYLNREKGNPEENQPLLNKENPKPVSARTELEENIKNAHKKKTSSEAEYKQVIAIAKAKIKEPKESKNTQEVEQKLDALNKLLSRYRSSQSSTTASPTPSELLQITPSEITKTTKPLNSAELPSQLTSVTTSPQSPASSREASPANSREASYTVISMDPAAQKVLDNKIEQATKGITDKSKISRIQQLVKADFDKKLLTNDPALDREIKEKKLELQREASPENSRTSSPTTSGSSSTLTQVRGILRSNYLSVDKSATGITWLDSGTKYTEGVEKREELESPAFSPASPASQARTASAGSPTIQFQNFNPEVTQLAEAAVNQARLSGRGAIKAEEDKQKKAIKADNRKQVEDWRAKIIPIQPSPVGNVFGGIGGQTPVEPSTSAPAPAPSNQAMAPEIKNPEQERREYIQVFEGNNKNFGKKPSPVSSNNGRAPFSPNNSFNTTRSNSESASSSSETGTSSRTGNSSRTQRTSSSITSQKSVTLPGGTKVKGTPAQVEAMQEALSSRGESPNRVADARSEIERRIKNESLAVTALDREIERAKGAYQVTSATFREDIGPGRTSKYGAKATSDRVESFNDSKGIGSSNNGNGNGGRGYTGR